MLYSCVRPVISSISFQGWNLFTIRHILCLEWSNRILANDDLWYNIQSGIWLVLYTSQTFAIYNKIILLCVCYIIIQAVLFFGIIHTDKWCKSKVHKSLISPVMFTRCCFLPSVWKQRIDFTPKKVRAVFIFFVTLIRRR